MYLNTWKELFIKSCEEKYKALFKKKKEGNFTFISREMITYKKTFVVKNILSL